MADLNNKKTVEEDDPIKKMLEKLRQSVAAPVADPAPEVAPSSKENEKTKEKNSGKRQKPAAKEEETESIAPVDIFEAGLVAEILPQEEVSAPVATVQPLFEETAFLPEEDKSVIAEMSEETEETEEDDALFDDDLDDEDACGENRCTAKEGILVLRGMLIRHWSFLSAGSRTPPPCGGREYAGNPVPWDILLQDPVRGTRWEARCSRGSDHRSRQR